MLKFAIAGSGLVSKKKHLPALLRLKDKLKVVAVCDLNKELAQEAAKTFKIEKTYSDFSQMLSVEKPDVVDICTPPQTHRKLAVEAIEFGANVLLEKPMATSVSDCDEIIKSAKKNGRRVGVIHNQIFNPAFKKGKRLFEEGVIGDFVGMHIFLSTPVDYMTSIKDHWSHKLPGGVLGETGPHSVYLATSFLKEVYDADLVVNKILSKYSWSNFEDFRIILSAKNGLATITQIYATNQWAGSIQILGTEGILNIDLQSQIVFKYSRTMLKASNVAISVLSGVNQTMCGLAGNIINYFAGSHRDAHSMGISEYVDSLIYDKPFSVSPEDGRENVKLMEFLVNKLEQKKSQVLNPV